MVRIRRFEEGDGPAVRRLHRVALAETGTDPADVPGTDDLADVEAAYIDAGGEFLVAEDGGEVVGMGGLSVGDDAGPPSAERARGRTEGELFRMRVHPDRQRSGIGSALLDRLEAAARERGVEVLHAETASRQAAATEFYPAHGYEETGRRSVGEYDLIAYAKEL